MLDVLKFVRLPKDRETGKEQKEFEDMLGHTYLGYYSEFGQGYVLCIGKDDESETAYTESIYKSLMATGWYSEEDARLIARGEEEPDGGLYFEKECFEKIGKKEATE